MPRNRVVGFWKTMCCVEDICHHRDSLLWMLVSVTRLRGLCLLHLLKSAFSAGQLQPLPPAFHAVLCGRKSPAQATLNDWGSASLWAGNLQKLFGILLRGRSVSSHPFIYEFDHLLTSVWTQGTDFMLQL